MKIFPPLNKMTRKQQVFGIGANTVSSFFVGLHFIFEFLVIIQLSLPFYFVIFHFVGEFEDIFHDVLVPWTGNIELFKPADRLILRYFK